MLRQIDKKIPLNKLTLNDLIQLVDSKDYNLVTSDFSSLMSNFGEQLAGLSSTTPEEKNCAAKTGYKWHMFLKNITNSLKEGNAELYRYTLNEGTPDSSRYFVSDDNFVLRLNFFYRELQDCKNHLHLGVTFSGKKDVVIERNKDYMEKVS